MNGCAGIAVSHCLAGHSQLDSDHTDMLTWHLRHRWLRAERQLLIMVRRRIWGTTGWSTSPHSLGQ